MSDFPRYRLRLARPDEIDLLMRIDDDSGTLFEEAGFVFTGEAFAPFVAAERRRWLAAAEEGLAEVAVDAEDVPIGFIVLGYRDGLPYLDQLSVVRRWMGRGVGRTLLARAIAWSESTSANELWLTTYAHVSWNGPMYARAGFTPVAEFRCGRELRAVLHEQRAVLPDPDQRVVMVRRAARGGPAGSGARLSGAS